MYGTFHFGKSGVRFGSESWRSAEDARDIFNPSHRNTFHVVGGASGKHAPRDFGKIGGEG